MELNRNNIDIQTNNNIDSGLLNIEKNENTYSSLNLQRTIYFCNKNFNLPKNNQEICNCIDDNLILAMSEKGIDFQKIIKNKNLYIKNAKI